MSNGRNPFDRDKPPEDQEEWRYIWDGARKGHDLHPIFGPIAAIARNWKAMAGVVALVAAFNAPTIREAILLLIGGMGQ
jgi:molybdopterin-guanine dinucleotide biosynthesis protein A